MALHARGYEARVGIILIRAENQNCLLLRCRRRRRPLITRLKTISCQTETSLLLLLLLFQRCLHVGKIPVINGYHRPRRTNFQDHRWGKRKKKKVNKQKLANQLFIVRAFLFIRIHETAAGIPAAFFSSDPRPPKTEKATVEKRDFIHTEVQQSRRAAASIHEEVKKKVKEKRKRRFLLAELHV